MSNVVDANCFSDYVDEFVAKAPATGTELFTRVLKYGGVLLDDEGRIRQQYIDMKKPYAQELFNAWFERTVLAGALRLVKIAGKTNLFKEFSDLGVPKSEHVYFRVAVHGGAAFLVSKDVDFFDPAKKGVNAEKRQQILMKADGPVCKHVKKVHGVAICCPDAYLVICP